MTSETKRDRMAEEHWRKCMDGDDDECFRDRIWFFKEGWDACAEDCEQKLQMHKDRLGILFERADALKRWKETEVERDQLRAEVERLKLHNREIQSGMESARKLSQRFLCERDELTQRLAESERERDEYRLKGEQLCNAYGAQGVKLHDWKKLAEELADAIRKFDFASTVHMDGEEKTPQWKGRWESARTGLNKVLHDYEVKIKEQSR